MNDVYALSIRQPWAELILSGKKTMELRTWATDYRGLLWLHTGLKSNPELECAFGFENLYKGGYLGSIIISGVIPLDGNDWEFYRSKHLDTGHYQSGYYGWFLESPHRFCAPIPGPGKLGLYTPAQSLTTLLKEANSAART